MSEIFAKRLKILRINKQKTQQDMAEMFGITSVSYGAWERGTAEPSIEKLIKLCKYFGVSSDWIIGIENPSQDNSTTEKLIKARCEAEQATATLSRLLDQLKEMSKSK